jgi:hypothetical protein
MQDWTFNNYDLSAYVILSEPDELDRYAKFYLFCPKDTIEKRSKEDRVPYQYGPIWVTSSPHQET